MSKRMILIAVVVLMFTFSISVSAQSLKWKEVFENPEVEFIDMKLTAYMIQGKTAMGVPTHEGICASDPHLGEVALVYTEQGEFIGQYYCCDTGGTDAIRAGYVLDIWCPDMESCKELMRITKGRCKVLWVKGVG